MSDALYHKRILELAAEAEDAPVLQHPHATARIDNPLCGDRVDAQVCIEDGLIQAASFKVRGCRLCEAAAMLIQSKVNDLPIEIWEEISADFENMVRTGAPFPEEWPDAQIFAPVHNYKSRHDCPLLPAQALNAALKQV